jgi:uncharacterized OB-fold protein
MNTRTTVTPPLYIAEGEPVLNRRVALAGGRCRECGNVFFPFQRYGCERCGSLKLEEFAITGRGRLVSSAKVHWHVAPDRQAPFTIGSVITDDGAVVRALLDPESADTLRPGDIVTTRLVPETREGRGSFDVRFGSGE